nr:immunoglobulin light chain junction region [Macaca mulatta]
CQQGRSYPLTF